ncbi:MAG TPA: ADOP family duplicated permease [Acidobacteriaceae bacterium]|nr:ADOP family duplicated permease [Acidobacteriaceae bacterium]
MGWTKRITNLFRRERVDAEIAEELAAHVEMAAEEAVCNGAGEAEARRAARLRFGNPVAMREKTAGADAALGLAGVGRDVKYALRQMRRSPGFAATVILTLGLAIGANLGVFRVLYSVLLAPLPVAHPEELVALHAVQSPFDHQWFFSYPAYQRLQRATGASAPVIARTGFGIGLLQMPSQAAPEARFQLVSNNFFSVLGVAPKAGRLFTEGDGRPSDEWPVVVRYGFALGRFGTTQLAGRHAILNGMPVVIIGVTEERFLGVVTGYAPDVWLPLEAGSTGRTGAWFDSLGPGHGIRLKDPWMEQPGIFWLWLTARVPTDQRSTAAARWTAALRPDLELMADAARTPQSKSEILHARMQLLSAAHGEGSLGEDSSLPLIVLMALTATVFLVGCLNLASLQAARMSARQQDFIVRISLGASRWRLLRQALTEGVLLTIAGGAAAIAIGGATSILLVHWASTRNWLLDLNLQGGTLGVLLGAGLMALALAVFSALPAWGTIRASFAGASAPKRIHAGIPQSASARRWSSAMLSAQVSLSVVLVAMSACFARTLFDLSRVDTGMDREHVLSVNIDMVHGYTAQHPNLPVLYRRLVERLEGVPQVRSAAVEMCRIPWCGWNTALHVFGHERATDAGVHGEENHIGPGYFRTMGIPLLRGRDFSEADRTDTPKVAIVNQTYAQKLFGSETPIGQWIGYEAAPQNHEFLVVGEVADARVDGPQYAPPPVVYLSIDQNPAPAHSIEVRTAGPAGAMAAQVRDALHAIDPELPVTEVVPLGTQLNDGLTQQKLLARLTAALAGLTLTLAALGFFGVMSYRVARRSSEMGIRLALGAKRWQVQAMVLRQTVLVLLAGIVPGLALIAAAVHGARSLLTGAASSNWPLIVVSILVLAGVGIVATLVPARRAARVSPMESLRAE